MSSEIHGVIPAIPTYFTDSDEIDYDQMGKCIDFVLGAGSSGIAVSMIGGEFYKLNTQERATIYKEAVNRCKNRVPVYAGVSHSGTIPALKLAKEAENAGVDYIIIMPPYYNPVGTYSFHDIALHYMTVGGGTRLPFIVQDFNYGIPLKLLKKLKSEYSNFAGIKIEGNDRQKIIERIKMIKRELGDDTVILGGMLGYNSIDEIMAGATGTIPGASLSDHLVPLYSRLTVKSQQNQGFSNVRKIMKYEVDRMQYFVYFEKVILKYRGITNSTNCRMPFTYPTERSMAKLLRLLKEAGINAGTT